MSDLIVLLARVNPGAASAGPGALKRTLTVDNTALSQELTDYPVKVELTGANFDFTQAKADGGDVRFYADAALSIPLDYDVESWDPVVETAVLFVKVPSIPAGGTVDLYLRYRDPALADASDPASVYTLFDDFTSTARHVLPMGSDSGWSCGFDPVGRRFYYFGQNSHQNAGWPAVPWTDLDTGDIGFAPPLPSVYNHRAVAYHAAREKFYLYGGRNGSGNNSDEIVSFDPATGTYETLSETLPAATNMSGQGAVYCPSDERIYLFGLDGENILVHDPAAGTVTDTGADLPFGAMQDISAVWADASERIYLVGGGQSGAPGMVITNRVDVYDPATPSLNPIPSGVVLSEAKTTIAVAYYEDAGGNGFLYVFGGFRNDLSTYSSKIEKITLVGPAIETLSATLHKADDDAIAFDDPVTGRIWSGPWIHSTGAENENDRKMVLVALDPQSDTLDAEPDLGDDPAGWTNTGSSTILKAAAFGSMLRVWERETGANVIALKTLAAPLSGEYMLEFRINPAPIYPVAGQESNDQCFVAAAGGTAFKLHNNGEDNWYLFTGINPGTLIAARDAGAWQILGALVDTANEQVWGLKDRANKTAAQNWFNSVPPDLLDFRSSAGGRGSYVVDWVKVRKSSVTAEPTVTLGPPEGA